MAEASAALAFERAAGLRDRLDSLRWLHQTLTRLRRATAHSCVYPVAGHNGDVRLYLIREGRVRRSLPAPEGELGDSEILALEEIFLAPGPRPGSASAGCPGLDEVDGVLLVDGWFRRHPEERERALQPGAILRSDRPRGLS
jgi:excinuclease ABC subunit C